MTSTDRSKGGAPPTDVSSENALLRRRIADLEAELARWRGERPGALRTWEDVLVCAVGEHRIALPLGEVREVVPLARTRPIPGAPHFIVGLLDLRGAELPVVDAAARVSKAPRRPALDEPIVACEADGIAFGLLVTRVLGVERIDPGTIDALPAELMQWDARARDRIAGIARAAGATVLLVSAEALGRDARIDDLLRAVRGGAL